MKLQVAVTWLGKRFYPINDLAKVFCKLLKQRCLSRRDIGIIRELGYEIEQIELEDCFE